MKKILRKILLFFFPINCSNCGKYHFAICKNCEKLIPILKDNEMLPEIFSVFPYRNDIVHDALWKLKYQNNREIGFYFGQKIWEQICEKIENDKKILLLTIPSHKKNETKRIYNQTEIIAKGILQNMPKDLQENCEIITNLLKQKRETQRQSMINERQNRIKNMQDVFEFNKKYLPKIELIKDAQIFIIDDITTTGQTLLDAKRALNEIGIFNIKLISVAH